MIDIYGSDEWRNFLVPKRKRVFTDLWNPKAKHKRSKGDTTEAQELEECTLDLT